MRMMFFAISVALMLFSTTVSAQSAETELPRFRQVSERLYRGAQPRTGGLRRLRELGIDTIINLRGAGELTRAEEAAARELGLNYFNVPLPNWGRPQDDRVRRILLIIAAPQNGRVFVHCRDGVDRTGTIVALHRVAHEGWSSHAALAEAERNGMRRIQFWMRDYAGEYGRSNTDFDDRLGVGARIVETYLHRAPGALSKFLGRVF
ncbi:MAG TPA: sulfur transferase domain-containing protein [Pyrinomonadaceae bacterium]|jgi:protein tyrosine/serine phosphatase|nr:sulfur transferase domain-containing protein [Pyrinomonadaceae bacterium]